MIDYLQLMQSESGSNNRVQEISEISRQLKGLARELNVPVLAAAQLSRAVEGRQDKRPMLSDLRDSGCLTGDSLVQIADSGELIPIKELAGQAGFSVLALNEASMKFESAEVSHAFCTGVKPIYQLTTKLGRTIKSTGNHKFLTFAGWKRLDELGSNDYLGLPRHLPVESEQSMTNDELALLGHLIGDGCVLPRHSLQYTTREPDLAEIVSNLASRLFPDDITPRISPERQWYQVYLASTRHHTHGVRNAISEWFEDLGIFGLRSYQKFVPAKVFSQPQQAVALFLRHLWATDGCVKLRRANGRFFPAVYYSSSSSRLVKDVQSLLLRLGINARVKRVPQGDKGRDQYHAIVSGGEDLHLFSEQIGAVGDYKTSSLGEIDRYLEQSRSNTNRDVIPKGVWRDHVVPTMAQKGISARQMQAAIGQTYCGTSLYDRNLSRERASRVAKAIDSELLHDLATSDLYWDRIVAIEPCGEAEVFDLTVPGHHNFVANNIVVHNSIEQDADIVMFIYRDEYYNPDTTDRPNIAEVSIAKHRHGPTATIDLYWHAQLATFRNLQRQEIQL